MCSGGGEVDKVIDHSDIDSSQDVSQSYILVYILVSHKISQYFQYINLEKNDNPPASDAEHVTGTVLPLKKWFENIHILFSIKKGKTVRNC